jgi:hypothetical protein
MNLRCRSSGRIIDRGYGTGWLVTSRPSGWAGMVGFIGFTMMPVLGFVRLILICYVVRRFCMVVT